MLEPWHNNSVPCRSPKHLAMCGNTPHLGHPRPAAGRQQPRHTSRHLHASKVVAHAFSCQQVALSNSEKPRLETAGTASYRQRPNHQPRCPPPGHQPPVHNSAGVVGIHHINAIGQIYNYTRLIASRAPHAAAPDPHLQLLVSPFALAPWTPGCSWHRGAEAKEGEAVWVGRHKPRFRHAARNGSTHCKRHRKKNW